MMKKREIGDRGEAMAVKKLKRMGYKIVERNFAAKCGEIDIIALDGEYIVFVEVRVRNNSSYGSGAETVDVYKQKKIIKTAMYYLQANDALDMPARFDVVSITDSLGNKPMIEVIKNAFETSCI